MNPYKEYTNYMIRLYFAQKGPSEREQDVLKGEVGNRTRDVLQANLECVRGIVEELAVRDREILRRVFSQSEHVAIAQAVRNCAVDMCISDRLVWHVVRSVSREIARRRGLI